MNRAASVPKKQVEKTRTRGLAVRARKTVAAPAAAVFAAWTQPRLRSRWLVGVRLTIREALAPGSVRLVCRDDDTEIAVAITPRGRAASAVVVDHSRLATAQLIAERRHCWKEMLQALKHYLERPDGISRRPRSRPASARSRAFP